MSNKMKITIEIENENGEVLVSESSEREVPYIEEIDAQGFRKAFDDYETAVLESRKEVSDEATSKYFEMASKKNGKRGGIRGYNGNKGVCHRG